MESNVIRRARASVTHATIRATLLSSPGDGVWLNGPSTAVSFFDFWVYRLMRTVREEVRGASCARGYRAACDPAPMFSVGVGVERPS